MPFLGRRSPYRPRPHRCCHLALLHRLPGSDLLRCGLSSRQFLARGFTGAATAGFLGRGYLWCCRLRCRYLGRRRLWRCYLGRCYLGRRVFGRRRSGRRVIGCGLLGRDLPGRRVPGCETLRYGDLRREQLGLGKLAHGELRRRWLRCGRCLPAFRQRLVRCRFKRGLDRADIRGPACRGPGQAALGTVPIEVQPALLRAGGGGRRLGNVGLGEQRPINGQKQGRHANGDHASECDQGGGDDETQMRVQGPSPSGRPRAAPIPGKNNGAGGTMSVWGAGSQRKSKLCLTRRGPWGQGAIRRKLGPRGKTLQPGQSSDSGRPAGGLPNTEKYARLVATAAYGR